MINVNLTPEDYTKVYSGRLMLRQIVLSSNIYFPLKNFKILILQSIIHAFCPFVTRLILDLYSESIHRFDRYYSCKFWIFTISCALINTWIFATNILFMDIGAKWPMRKLFSMKILNALIEPNKYKKQGVIKIFPLINFIDPKTMLSWLDMRVLTQDIGLRFDKRIGYYYVIYIISYTLLGGVGLLYYFDIFKEK